MRRIIRTIAAWFDKERKLLLLALLAAVIAAVPLLLDGGLVNTRGGGDSPFLLQRTHQMATALRDGHFPVRWMPDANYGHGYPFFNFYAPLSIYMTAALKLLGFTYVRAIQLAQVAGFLVAAWGMFKLAKQWTDNAWSGLLASVAYTTAPFHMVNVYVRGDSLAEFWAMAFYPLILLSADTLIRHTEQNSNKPFHSAAFAVSYAALVLSHNISALIFTPFLALFLLIRIAISSKRSELIGTLLAAGGMGLLLSAWFWIPALIEKGQVQLGAVTEGFFHFGQHFRTLDLTGTNPIIQTSPLFNYDVSEGGAFRMGMVQLILTFLGGLAGLVFAVRQRAYLLFFLFVVLVLTAATFMISPDSSGVWENAPLVSFTQFPWRFLSVQAVATALLAGYIPTLLPNNQAWARGGITLIFSLVLLVAALGDLRPDYLPITDEDVTAVSLAQYEWATGNIGTTISAEYLPQGGNPRPWTSDWLNQDNRHAIRVTEGAIRSYSPEVVRSSTQIWRFELTELPTTIVLPTIYWQGWEVMSFACECSLNYLGESQTGLIELSFENNFQLQPDKIYDAYIHLTIAPSSSQVFGQTVSLFSAIWLLMTLLRWRPIRYLAPAVLLLAAATWFINNAITTPFYQPDHTYARTFDYEQKAFFHEEGRPILFDNGLSLHDFWTADTVQAGATLEANMRWRNATPNRQVTLSLVSPATYRSSPARPVPVFAEREVSSELGQFIFPIPAETPPGLYLLRLTTDGRALTPAGHPRGDLYVGTVRVTAAPDQDSAPATRTPVDVRVNAVTTLPNGNLRVHLAYHTDQPLPLNYRLSLQLNDSRSFFYAKHDTQPGYGYQPTSTWPIDVWIDEIVELNWVADDGVAPYKLIAQLYLDDRVVFSNEIATLVPDGEQWQVTAVTPRYTLPADVAPFVPTVNNSGWPTDTPQDALLAVSLAGYTLDVTDESVNMMLYWQQPFQTGRDYQHFVQLIDETGVLCDRCQHDGRARFGNYPTHQWLPNEIVEDPVFLSLEAVPPGQYTILVGMYAVDVYTQERINTYTLGTFSHQ